jgi:DNA-directed RNA polymerase specialized sigma24 family protein
MSTPALETIRTEARAGRTVGSLEDALEIFVTQRTRLFRIAYRVTGDAAGAEDVVQDAWLRWQRTDRAVIKNPAAFLTTTTTHLAINVIQSARHRHETPAESPLCDLAGTTQDPTASVEQAAVVEQILGLLTSRLSSAELAAYLLRKGFGYAYGDIATLLRTSAPNTRQLVRRAQVRIESGRERTVDPAALRDLAAAFLRAARAGDLESLERLLAQDCGLNSPDGGDGRYAGCGAFRSSGPVRERPGDLPSVVSQTRRGRGLSH